MSSVKLYGKAPASISCAPPLSYCPVTLTGVAAALPSDAAINTASSAFFIRFMLGLFQGVVCTKAHA